MKKYFIFTALTALAVTSCTNDEILNPEVDPNVPVATTDQISFSSFKTNLTRGDIYGSDAATILGKNFIVEGTKGKLPSANTTTTVVFDNYLVTFNENTADKTESNTSNWEYVGVSSSAQVGNVNTLLGRTVDQQTIKYWDYSVPQYDFVAYSTGTKKMVGTTPAAGQIKVTKIDGTAKSYSFTGLSADDLKEVYITDIVTVEKSNYGQPVVLKFKNLTSKVRMALYETVPGYSVKDVQFYPDDDVIKYVAAASVNHADVFTTAVYDASDIEYAIGTAWKDGTYYNATGADESNKVSNNSTIHGDVLTDDYFQQNGTAYTKYVTVYDSQVAYYVPQAAPNGTTATLFNTASALPTSGTINVTYPHTGTTHRDATPQTEDYNKANVTVTAGSEKSNTQTFSTLAANTLQSREHKEDAAATLDKLYLGRTSSAPTFAGDLADNYYQSVIPNPEGLSLTLRVNYTLVSTDGSNETIKVWGAKAVVPATFTKWQSNYAYTYLFKISDKSNGSTEELGGKENLFPITFDAVVAQVVDATAEQTTITTVATPSITTFQKDHVYKDASTTGEYLASKGTIYTMVKKADGNLAEDLDTKGQLYTVATSGAPISEASVMDALLKTVSGSADVNGRNGIALTNATSTVGNSYVNLEGNTVTLTGKSNCVASFTPVANTYAYVYEVAAATTAGTYTAYQPKSYDVDANVVGLKSITYATIAGTTDLAANETANKDFLYFQVTKNAAGTETHYSYITVVPGKTLVAAGEGVKKIAKSSLTTEGASAKAVASTFYFDTYEVKDTQYGVKIILVK